MSSRMVEQFIEMVKIDSESGNEQEMIGYLNREFRSMGAETHIDKYGNLLARFSELNTTNNTPVLLACHADTVKPGTGIQPLIENGVIRSKGKTILGADDKAGIADMLEALRTAKQRPVVEVVITRQEEVGLLGVKIKVDNPFTTVKIPGNAKTVKVVKQALKYAGIEASASFITGFTDASIYNNKGIETAVVGIGAKLEHSTDEHIYISDMEKAVLMIKEILRISSE